MRKLTTGQIYPFSTDTTDSSPWASAPPLPKAGVIKTAVRHKNGIAAFRMEDAVFPFFWLLSSAVFMP
ncbi:MAG: hypothetical protein HZA17_05265 [Nitrospirae bacterium]|nr:hypothetical protein [Nitrospirota bacterium]